MQNDDDLESFAIDNFNPKPTQTKGISLPSISSSKNTASNPRTVSLPSISSKKVTLPIISSKNKDTQNETPKSNLAPQNNTNKNFHIDDDFDIDNTFNINDIQLEKKTESADENKSEEKKVKLDTQDNGERPSKRAKKNNSVIDLDTIEDIRGVPLYKLMNATGGKLSRAEEEKKKAREEALNADLEIPTDSAQVKTEIKNDEEEEEEEEINLDEDPLVREAKQFNANPHQDTGGPRMVIDADGNLVFDEESFTVKAKKRDINSLKVVDDKDKKKCVGYGTRARRDTWTEAETDLFYKALRQVGCDFEIIKLYFPGKTRTQVRNKFKKEEKNNSTRIDFAMKNPLELDVEEWSKATNHEIPEDFDVEEFQKELEKEAKYQKTEDPFEDADADNENLGDMD